LILVFFFFAPKVHAATFGASTSSYPGNDADENGWVMYFMASTTPASNGTLNSITMVGVNDASETSGNYYLAAALYTASGTGPGTLIAQSTATSTAGLLGNHGVSNTTSTANLSASITAGTQYWFAVYVYGHPTDWLEYRMNDTASNTAAFSSATSFPTNASGLTYAHEAPFIYATYTPITPPPLKYWFNNISHWIGKFIFL